MFRATWNGAVIAESDRTVVVEGNHYFPPETVDQRYLRSAPNHTTCHWKGVASYFDVVVDDTVNEGAAWLYPRPLPAAERISGHIAFWKGIKVREVSGAEAGAAASGGSRRGRGLRALLMRR